MTTVNKIIDYNNQITNFQVNDLIVKPLKVSKISNDLLTKVPTINSLNSWIKWKLIYGTYILIFLGILTLCLFFSFIGLYVEHQPNYEGVLIAAIVFAIIVICCYAFLIVAMGFTKNYYLKSYPWNLSY